MESGNPDTEKDRHGGKWYEWSREEKVAVCMCACVSFFTISSHGQLHATMTITEIHNCVTTKTERCHFKKELLEGPINSTPCSVQIVVLTWVY